MSYGIVTDRGTIRLGSYFRVTDDPNITNDRICHGILRGTDLVTFFGLAPPWVSLDDAKEIKATLKNGNVISARAWLNSYGDLKTVFTFYKNGSELTNINIEVLQGASGAPSLPPVEMAFFNGVNIAPAGKVEWGIAGPATDTGYVPDYRYNHPPYKYKWAWSLSIVDPSWGILPTFKFLRDFCEGSEAPTFPGPDNEKDPEGGDGDGPEGIEDDPIEAPEDPSISAVASGLLTLYTPTLGQIHAFGEFLWSDLFSLDTFKKLFSDPMQAVIGLSALPISVPSSGAQNIIIGSVDSGVSANRAAKQFVRKDCGTIHIKPTWNTALDYEPYTKFSIFLPYIGTRELKTDDIMNKDINVSYLIDILSGSCTAHIKVGGSVLYQFSGSCAVPIPVTGTSWNNLLTSCIQLAGAGIVTAASGGAASAAVAGAMAASSTANMVANAKPNIQRTGAVSGAAGMLGVQTPYLIRETPRQSLAKGYNKFVGYPSNITSKLGDLKGYTQVENIHLENLSCTADEAAEIESLLKEGVII